MPSYCSIRFRTPPPILWSRLLVDDADIYYTACDLARCSDEHAAVLADHGRRYDVPLSGDPGSAVLTEGLTEGLDELIGPRTDRHLTLLADLRRLHLAAADASLGWELLGQGAQALKDDELLELTSRCHPQTLRQMRWANAVLKERAPQALTPLTAGVRLTRAEP